MEAYCDEHLPAKRARRPQPPPTQAELAAEAAAGEAAVAELRVRSSLLLADALRDDSPLADVALAVEGALDEAHGAGSPEYRAAVRTLVASLRRNAPLGDDVRAGRVSAAKLVALPTSALATRQQVEARRSSEARLLRKADRSVLHGGTATSEHVCHACGARDACFVRVGGMRDGPKCDTWGRKDDSDASTILLRCLKCSSEWTSEAHA
jgi:hypothetical protein